MILTIDTACREKIILGLFNKGGGGENYDFATDNQSEDLLVAIEGILKRKKLTLKDLTAILVNRGPGSFTGVRVGVTTANALGWSLNISVFGYQNGKIESALKKILQNKSQNFSRIVLPSYTTPLKKVNQKPGGYRA